MSDINEQTNLTAANEHRERMYYVWGLLSALFLTLIPFGLVYSKSMDRSDILVVVGVFAIIQMFLHFRFFLHVGWKQRREDLLLLIFSGALLSFLIIGTLWVMSNLAIRMMEIMPGMGM